MQSNSVAQAVQTSFGVSPVYTGVVLTVLTAIVVLGGIRNIATASSFIVPVMAVLYVLGGLGIIVLNLHLLVPAVQCILQDAFTGQAVVGGAVGTVIRYESDRWFCRRWKSSSRSTRSCSTVSAAPARKATDC